MADEFNLSDFIVIGFSRRIEFIIKAKSLNILLFCAILSANEHLTNYKINSHLQ